MRGLHSRFLCSPFLIFSSHHVRCKWFLCFMFLCHQVSHASVSLMPLFLICLCFSYAFVSLRWYSMIELIYITEQLPFKVTNTYSFKNGTYHATHGTIHFHIKKLISVVYICISWKHVTLYTPSTKYSSTTCLMWHDLHMVSFYL